MREVGEARTRDEESGAGCLVVSRRDPGMRTDGEGVRQTSARVRVVRGCVAPGWVARDKWVSSCVHNTRQADSPWGRTNPRTPTSRLC